MIDNNLSVYLIGPSNAGISNLWNHGKINENDYNSYIYNIANIVNNSFSVVGCIPDISVPFDIVTEISKLPNKKVKIQGFFPKYGDDLNLSEKKELLDELIGIEGGWSKMNTEISKNFDLVICCGLSAGVFTEISHTKVHRLWCNKITPILIDERVISSHLNVELEKDVCLKYFNSDEELQKIINQYMEGK